MEFGQRIRQARLESGLSQRQLCGGVITRNMLSQIENGTARPSMDTLSYLARQLGKPISWFLEESAVTSPNQTVMEQARRFFGAGSFDQVIAVLQDYREPDAVFDWEKEYLFIRSLLQISMQAIKEDRKPYARQLLQEAAQAGEKTPYYSRETEGLLQLLLAQAGENAVLPNVDDALLAHAKQAVHQQDWEKAGRLLDACEGTDALWQLLRGQVFYWQKNYAQAVICLKAAEDTYLQAAVPLLEQCYRAMEDYKMAYYYACKQKNV